MNIPTAEEFLKEPFKGINVEPTILETKILSSKMVEFAKLHVTAALNSAKIKVDEALEPYCSNHTPYRGNCVDCGRTDNPDVIKDEEALKDTILNAYSLNNIK